MADVAADAADLRGEAGLRGETGRAMRLFAGEIGFIGLVYSLIGDRGSVRELCERGERTEAGFVVRDTARVGAAALLRVFFATGRVSGAG
jgi:hypothetical protein